MCMLFRSPPRSRHCSGLSPWRFARGAGALRKNRKHLNQCALVKKPRHVPRFFCVSCAAYGYAVRLRVKRGKLLRREFNIRRPDVFRGVFWLCRSGNRDDIRVLRHNPAERNLSNARAHAAEADFRNLQVLAEFFVSHSFCFFRSFNKKSAGRRFTFCAFKTVCRTTLSAAAVCRACF